jgi:hypothetical protein
MPGPPPEVTTNRARREGMVHGPIGQHMRQPPRVLVVAGHLHRRLGALELQIRCLAGGNLRRFGRLLMAGRRLRGAGVFQQLQGMIGLLAPAKPCRAEKHHRVLYLLPPEACQRLHILGDNPEQPPVGAVQKARSFHRPAARIQAVAAHRCTESPQMERQRRLFPVPCSLFPVLCSLFPVPSYFIHPDGGARR